MPDSLQGRNEAVHIHHVDSWDTGAGCASPAYSNFPWGRDEKANFVFCFADVPDRDFFFGGGVFLQPHLWHVEVPGLGVESELHLPAYATATAMRDLSYIFDPCWFVATH